MAENRTIKKRKISIVTGSRAEYGILRPLLEKISNSRDLELRLVVTGMHLLKKFGLTINDIKKDGFKIDAVVPMYLSGNLKPAYHGEALARGINGFTRVLLKTRPDILVVLGDRLEPLAAVLAAAILKIPIAHIFGGDKTDSGHIDENTRHAITRFASLHFAATNGHRRRLIKMGEEVRRIYQVGSLGLDSILGQRKINKELLFKKLNLNSNKELIICIFHPVHLEASRMGEEMREITGALKELKKQTVILYPNNDAGSQNIIREIDKVKNLPFIKIFSSLPHEDYISLMKYASVIIGNSSSGILESTTIKLPAINIGSRNIGREHGENVVFIKAKKNTITKAVNRALKDNIFRRGMIKCKNPYGDGRASDRIAKILKEVKIDKKLLRKKLTY